MIIEVESPWIQSGSDIRYSAGNVGIGAGSIDALLDVHGAAWFQSIIGDPSGNTLDILLNTLDASDNKGLRYGGGGDIIATRGAWLALYGNEYPTVGLKGKLDFRSGNAGNATLGDSDIVFIPGPTGIAAIYIEGSSGNVGMGIDTPETSLHLRTNNDVVLVAESTDSGAFTELRDDSSTVNSVKIGAVGDALQFRILNVPRMALIETGLGIGTNSPDRKLEILDSAFPQLRLTQTDAVTYVDFEVTSAGNLEVNMDGQSTQLVLKGDGKVGIGMNSPNENLQVDDSIALSNESEGSIARLTMRSSRDLVTLSGATTDSTAITIPSGARLLGVSMTVNTAVVDDAGDNTWSAAFITGSTTTIVVGAAAAQNTKVNFIVPDEKTTDITEIQFTPNAGNFTAGVIEIVAYYEDLTNLAN